MKNKMFERAFEDVTLSGGARERIIAAAMDEEGTRRRAGGRAVRPLRVALAAVLALCLISGTALAACLTAGGFREFRLLGDGEDINGYGTYGGEYQFVPLEDLSDKVTELMTTKGKPGNETRYFMDESWEAAEEFSGVTLPENPAIDELDIGGCFLQVDSNSDGPTHLHFQQWSRELGVSMSAEVYTELMEGADLTVERTYNADYEFSTGEYTAQNGLSAVVLHLMPGDDVDGETVTDERYVADFLLGAFRYHVQVQVDGKYITTSEQALDTLHGILEGFVL